MVRWIDRGDNAAAWRLGRNATYNPRVPFLSCLSLIALLAAALSPAEPSQAAAPTVSRGRFAAAYLRFEEAFRGARLSSAEEVRVNRAFDGLTLLFFTGQLAKAMDSLDSLTASIDPQAPPARIVDLEARMAAAGRLRPEAVEVRSSLEGLAVKPELAASLAAAKARAGLLAAPFDPENTAQALIDPSDLLAQVKAEARALSAGRDPFAGREGDFWRVFQAGAKNVPVRIFVPAGKGRGTTRPLLIALHGAGGDENMFLDGYGAGLIKTLAAAHGAIVASPRTEPFGGQGGGEALDALLATMQAAYPIDPGQVYLIGHSMGGTAVNKLAAARRTKIAAAACLCGFHGFADGASGIPPVLVIAGELDPIVSPARIQPAFQRAKAAGLPVEYRLIRNYGHTLTVARVLPEAVDWLFARGKS